MLIKTEIHWQKLFIEFTIFKVAAINFILDTFK